MEITTYADLKAFCNTLTEDQLQKQPFVSVLDDLPVNIREGSVNDIDYFYNEDSEGLIPVTDYDPVEWEGEPLESDYNTIVPAGTIVWLYDDSFFDETKPESIKQQLSEKHTGGKPDSATISDEPHEINQAAKACNVAPVAIHIAKHILQSNDRAAIYKWVTANYSLPISVVIE